MKEQLINDVCMMFSRAMPDVDLSTVRNIMELALSECEVTRYTKEVTVYQGDSNDRILKAFLVAKRVAGASNKTIRSYDHNLNKFLSKTGNKRIDELNANDIRIYFAKRELEDGVSAVTRNNERSVLCSFFQWLTAEELITKNPMLKVPKIKEPKIQKKAFTQMELEQIRANCTTEMETAVIEILISTGCRVSELCGIKLSDIDCEQVTVHGKGNKDRICYLTARAQLAIHEYMNTARFKKHAGEYLFANRQGKQMTPSGIQSLTKRIGFEANVSDCHPHRFRRTCATMALERGMPIERVSYMLGHESVETTQVYLDLTEQGMKDAHKKYVC